MTEVYTCDQPGCPTWPAAAAFSMFVVRIRDETYCLACWKKAGCPWPGPCTAHEAELARQRIIARMLERGGTDRHLARDGHT